MSTVKKLRFAIVSNGRVYNYSKETELGTVYLSDRDAQLEMLKQSGYIKVPEKEMHLR